MSKKYLTDISDDEIYEKLYTMTLKEILNARLISKRWNRIISDDKFWCQILRRDFGDKETKDCFKKYKSIKQEYLFYIYKYDREDTNDIIGIYKDVNIAVKDMKKMIKTITKKYTTLLLMAKKEGEDLLEVNNVLYYYVKQNKKIYNEIFEDRLEEVEYLMKGSRSRIVEEDFVYFLIYEEGDDVYGGEGEHSITFWKKKPKNIGTLETVKKMYFSD